MRERRRNVRRLEDKRMKRIKRWRTIEKDKHSKTKKKDDRHTINKSKDEGKGEGEKRWQE